MGTTLTHQSWCPVSVLYRRSCCLDVEISASGFTKEMEQDGALLHPAGPESDEEDHDEEEEEYEGESENGEVQGVDMEEYKHAMRELDGLKLGETRTDSRDAEEEKEEETRGGEEEEEEETKTSDTQKAEQEVELKAELKAELAVCSAEEGEGKEGREEAGGGEQDGAGRGEEEDRCPELHDLSAANRGFKPFR